MFRTGHRRWVRGWRSTRTAGRGGRTLAVVAMFVSLALTAGASAQAAVTPPPGTQDLSQMVLQRSDFSHAGTILQQGYTTPPNDAIAASYIRVFGASTLGRTHFGSVESGVRLATNADTATQLFQIARFALHLRQGREAILRPFIRGFNQGVGPVLHFSDFDFQRMHRLGVGDASFILPSTFAIDGILFSVDIIGVRVDQAVGTMLLAGVGSIHRADALSLARDIATRMNSVLTNSTA